MLNYNLKTITAMFSEDKVTEIFIWPMNSASFLMHNRKNQCLNALKTARSIVVNPTG